MKILRLCAAALLVAHLSACGSMNVMSDGADSRLMLQGNDPVAYFTVGKPVKGDPAKYTPQYGGFCSNGMAYAVPIAVETDTFKIINGKLYMLGGLGSKLFFEMDQEKNPKLADLAVLSKDYLSVPVEEIGGIHSVLTMVGGRVVYAEGPYNKYQ